MLRTVEAETLEGPLYFAYRRKSESNSHRETFHSHKGLEILLIHEGSGTMVVGHRTYELSAGMLCIFQPHQLHHLQLTYSGNQSFERSIAIFDPALFEAYFGHWPGLHAFYKHLFLDKLEFPCIYGVGDDSEAAHIFGGMSERIGQLGKQDRMEEISLFLVALCRAIKPIWQRREGDLGLKETRKTRQTERIFQWVESHYAEPFRLDAMSKELHVSPYHLSHLFKEETGTTITEYITARRINQAVKLLTATHKPISIIAEEIGISNSSYFCAFFKARMGVTPHQYRKQRKRG